MAGYAVVRWLLLHLTISLATQPGTDDFLSCNATNSCDGTGAILMQTSQALSIRKRTPAVQCTRQWDRYHTSQELLDCIVWLSQQGRCAVPLSTEWVKDKDNEAESLFVARLGNVTADKRVLIAANEHAREIITAEIALRFVEKACDGGEFAETLAAVGVTVLPMVNLEGRKAAESGTECLRYTVESEGSVDLNRNMDVDFSASISHGPQPFSTFQARIMRDLATAEKPLAYIDLHSGAKSLMVSWGARWGVTPDYDAQRLMLAEVQKGFCQDCAMGSNRVVISYMNEGEIIDHMYAKQGIKYSTLWEVYRGPGDCREMFNPPDDKLDEVSANWAGALARAALFVRDNVRTDERSVQDAIHTDPIDTDHKGGKSLAQEFAIPVDHLTT